MEKQPKTGALERGATFLEKLHYSIGAVALGGFAAETLTGISLIRPEILALVGVVEIGHGLIINGLKRLVKNRGKTAPALA